jgi:hypothetical protein
MNTEQWAVRRHLRTPKDGQAAMRELHARLEAYVEGLARRHLGS